MVRQSDRHSELRGFDSLHLHLWLTVSVFRCYSCYDGLTETNIVQFEKTKTLRAFGGFFLQSHLIQQLDLFGEIWAGLVGVLIPLTADSVKYEIFSFRKVRPKLVEFPWMVVNHNNFRK